MMRRYATLNEKLEGLLEWMYEDFEDETEEETEEFFNSSDDKVIEMFNEARGGNLTLVQLESAKIYFNGNLMLKLDKRYEFENIDSLPSRWTW